MDAAMGASPDGWGSNSSEDLGEAVLGNICGRTGNAPVLAPVQIPASRHNGMYSSAMPQDSCILYMMHAADM